MISTVAVVPVKELSQAKQRLSSLLNQEQRARLFKAMLEDVLASLQQCPLINRTLVISNDPIIKKLALQYGAEVLPEPHQPGLNSAVTAASKLLAKQGVARMLFVPGDLPLLTSQELEQVLEQNNLATSQAMQGHKILTPDKGNITLVPSADLDGSNCIVCMPPDCLPFSFGEQSFERHLQIAKDLNIKTDVAHQPGMALDIDTENDLINLMSKFEHSKNTARFTQRCLKDSGIKNNILKKQKASQALFVTEENVTFNQVTVDQITLNKSWTAPADKAAMELSFEKDTARLMHVAATLRDQGHGNSISFSKKVFIPLTHLCRDVCHYCTFAQVPSKLKAPYLSPDEVIEIAKQGAEAGCKEALFTLGDSPESRYKTARSWLKTQGYSSTLDYLKDMAERVFNETGLMPHLNPGLMSAEELAKLKSVSVSMGIMLESASDRLTEKGMPHHGSPDKVPARRIETIRLAGEQGIPFTSGLLIGIGETRQERVEALLVLRNLHQQYGHIQEIIIQNFRAKPETKMAKSAEPDLNELLWTIAITRIIFGPSMNIQAPPNLSPGVLPQLINAGLNDWGGISPITPDYVNPEAPWPHLEKLADETKKTGKLLVERLAIYPEYALDTQRWTDPTLSKTVFSAIDGEGFARNEDWAAGLLTPPPTTDLNLIKAIPSSAPNETLQKILNKATLGVQLNETDIVVLLKARGSDFTHVCNTANKLRKTTNGKEVTYVINRNINYTNICYFKCQFCAFSKGKTHENLRGKPYNIPLDEIAHRVREAWERGATEVCLQGGIHPDYTGKTYLDICKVIKEAVPEIHIHAFSPLEIWQGAQTLGLPLSEYLRQLKEAGLATLPGTAAEILDDEVRASLCPDKINTQQWLEVMEAAHNVGFATTATIMFGHIEKYKHLARHLILIRELQKRTGGFTEFVPLPFVHMQAPIYLKGRARKGPTFREAMLMHAVSRLVLHPYIKNIQGSWTKLGHAGVQASLNVGVNDLGGTLMNESITRAAGASHGQETSSLQMERLVESVGRISRQRTTTYGLIKLPKGKSLRAIASLTV